MSAAPVPLSARQFQEMAQELRGRLSREPDFRRVVQGLCGGPEGTERLTRPPGLGISAFAALVGLPASTVRHYQRLGLITPYVVNGKFRFWLHNVVQVESVRQWRDLGLSLADIGEQQAGSRLGGQAVTFNLPSLGGLSALVTDKGMQIGRAELKRPGAAPNRVPPGDIWLPLETDKVRPHATRAGQPAGPGPGPLLAEVREARQRLETQLRVLEGRVERARQLEALLGRAASDA